MIAALFVDPEGPYVGQPAVDPWDELRDARSYAGQDPVVAHPPCERWGRFAEGSPVAKRFTAGDDGGCFATAVANVRRVGGVLEHPQGSLAWEAFGMPIPEATRERSRGWTVPDIYGGRSCHVDQGSYGHKAQKPTWLYAVLPVYPKMTWGRVWGLARVGGDGFHSSRERARAKATGRYKPFPQIPQSENHLTPPDFRDALLALAESCQGWKPSVKQVQATFGKGAAPEGSTDNETGEFVRFSPEGKERIAKALGKGGIATMMCPNHTLCDCPPAEGGKPCDCDEGTCYCVGDKAGHPCQDCGGSGMNPKLPPDSPCGFKPSAKGGPSQ